MQLSLFGDIGEKVDAKKEFKDVKKLVLQVLERYPETRDSDTKLYFRCLRVLGAKTIREAEDLNLNMVSVHKTRQIIQNKMDLFPPSKDVKDVRKTRKHQIKDYVLFREFEE